MRISGEAEWIRRLTEVLGAAAEFPEGQGIGDDAAILAADGDAWAWTIDTLVEGVHFRFDWLDPEAVGHRALAASLSDLAAMGARPAGALVTAAGPPPTLAARLEGVYRGVAGLARSAGCPILGGDLSRAEGALHLTVTALGRCASGPPLLRSGARPGDALWVTGALGAPAAALALLETGVPMPGARAPGAYERLARPQPRNREVEWLRERAELSAAIDISDGLSSDAHHMARASGVQIAIDPGRLPLHPSAREAARRLGREALDWALHGGEEFEILFAAPPGTIEPHQGLFAEALAVPLTRIGSVARGQDVVLVRDGSAEPLAPGGWDHFDER